jgi:hypothetical protein
LVILNWVLILDALGIIVIGSFVWFFTLKERNNFHEAFSQQSTQNMIAIQDQVRPANILRVTVTDSLQLKCCGYFNTSDLLTVGGNVCTSQAASNQLNTTCVGPITSFADTTLNDIFT